MIILYLWLGGTSTYGPIIYRSTNGGVNFTQLPRNGITTRQAGSFPAFGGEDASTIFVGDGTPSGDGTVFITRSSIELLTLGTNWTLIDQSGRYGKKVSSTVSYSPGQIRKLVSLTATPSGSTGNFLMWKTTNGGVNWTKFTFTAPNAYGAQNSVFCIDANFF
ncbi:MAG: hypothetical protein AB2L26_05940, partial [Ignavibacteria bacterium]